MRGVTSIAQRKAEGFHFGHSIGIRCLHEIPGLAIVKGLFYLALELGIVNADDRVHVMWKLWFLV